MKHIMMDLETRGTVAGCVVFSLGLVVMNFETGKLEEEFYSLVSISDSLAHYLEEDADTVEWWDKQSPAARASLLEAQGDGAPGLRQVMEDLNGWFSSIGATARKTRLYGNGADFDNPILRVMQKAAKVLPFGTKAGFYGGRCYRTLKTLDEVFGPAFAFSSLERSGTYHNALDDAKSQATHLMRNVQRIRAMGFNRLDDGK